MGSEGTTNLPPKKDVARALLLRGSVFVHLDPRVDTVRVPPWLMRQPQLVLQVGLDMPIPIPDLRVDDEGVYGTLSFNRSPHTCMVPWDSVFALVGEDGRGMVWPESMPEEIADEVEREAGHKGPPPPQGEDDLSPRGADAKVVSLEARRNKPAATHPITRRAPDAPDAPDEPDELGPAGGREGRGRDDATVPIPQASPEHAPADAEPFDELDPDAELEGLDGEDASDAEDGPADDAGPDEGNGKRSGSNGRGAGHKKRRRPLPPYLKVVK